MSTMPHKVGDFLEDPIVSPWSLVLEPMTRAFDGTNMSQIWLVQPMLFITLYLKLPLISYKVAPNCILRKCGSHLVVYFYI